MSDQRRPATGPTVEAVRVETLRPDAGEFSYTVLIDAKPLSAAERRDAPRQRTRLRSGKIIDAGGRFLTECLVHDLSETGMRLRVPAGANLPATFQVYDDRSGRLTSAEVSWVRDGEAGIQFKLTEETPRSRIVAADMRRRFYKMPR